MMNSGDSLLFFAQGLHLFQAWVGQESGLFGVGREARPDGAGEAGRFPDREAVLLWPFGLPQEDVKD